IRGHAPLRWFRRRKTPPPRAIPDASCRPARRLPPVGPSPPRWGPCPGCRVRQRADAWTPHGLPNTPSPRPTPRQTSLPAIRPWPDNAHASDAHPTPNRLDARPRTLLPPPPPDRYRGDRDNALPRIPPFGRWLLRRGEC